MEQERKSILVTWDFSTVSYNALKHAIKLAHILKNNILLFHIVKDQAEVESAGKKLEETAERINALGAFIATKNGATPQYRLEDFDAFRSIDHKRYDLSL